MEPIDTTAIEIHPLWVNVIDYILGMIMWTLIGRSAMNLFLPEDSDWFFMKVFVRATNPILRVFRPITPSVLVPLVVPLYVAWFFYCFTSSFNLLQSFTMTVS